MYFYFLLSLDDLNVMLGNGVSMCVYMSSLDIKCQVHFMSTCNRMMVYPVTFIMIIDIRSDSLDTFIIYVFIKSTKDMIVLL